MKISVLLIEDAKQIMLTPENDHEKQALKMIAPTDKIEAVSKWGSFTDKAERTFGLNVEMCQGGYLRGYQSDESLMFVITSKEKDES